MPATYRTATRRPTLLTGAAWRRGPRYWGDVAVVDVKTSAIKAWVAKMAADEVGAPTIENAFGLLRQVMGAALEDNRIARNPCDGVRLPKRQHAGYSAATNRLDSQPQGLPGLVRLFSVLRRETSHPRSHQRLDRSAYGDPSPAT